MDSNNLGRRCKSLQEYPSSVSAKNQRQQQPQHCQDKQSSWSHENTNNHVDDMNSSEKVDDCNLNSIGGHDETLLLLRRYALEQNQLLEHHQVVKTLPQTGPTEQCITITEKDGEILFEIKCWLFVLIYS